MRGSDGMQEALFTLAKLEDFVPTDHPLRAIRDLVNEALGRLGGLFNLIYADTGRASIAPEKLLRAMLIKVFFSVRSERQLMEQVRYNLLYRWFIGLAIDDTVWILHLLQEPRPPARTRRGGELLHRGHGLGRQAPVAVQRALLGGRHADPGLGPATRASCPRTAATTTPGASGGAGGRNTQANLEGQTAQQRHSCQHHRP